MPAETKEFRHVEMSKLVSTFRHRPSNLSKCRNSFDMSKLPKLWLVKITIDRRMMIYSSLEPPRRAESNGGKIVILRTIDGKLLSKTSTIRHVTALFYILLNIYGLDDRRKVIYSSLEPHRRSESNGGKIMFLRSIVREILNETSTVRQVFA